MRGYKEKGNINTPLELSIENEGDRFSLAIDVIDRVRKLFKADIPSVVLTGETAPESLLEGQRRGCAFLHKPLHPGELRRVLEEVRRDGKAGC